MLAARNTPVRVLAALALVAALVASGCGKREAPDLVKGKTLFASTARCGSCHTLARASTKGNVGPNLDYAFEGDKRDGLGQSAIRAFVMNQIAHPRKGSVMPTGLAKGQDAFDIASYVAYAAAATGKDPGELASAGQVTSGPPAVAKGGTLTIAANPTGALAFTTNKASAPAGSIKFVMPNKSPIQHNLAIKGPVTGAGPIVGSGGSSTFTANLKPGSYTFFCQVPGHEAGGMKGTLTVK